MKDGCDNQFDERFYDSGMTPTNEFELMYHSGVLEGFESRIYGDNFF